MVVPIGYKGLGILVLNSFMVAPVIRICGLSLSKYISFALLGNAAWLDIVDVVVASPILPVLGFLVVHFCIALYMSSISIITFCGILIDEGCHPVPVTELLLSDHEIGPDLENVSSEISSNASGLN